MKQVLLCSFSPFRSLVHSSLLIVQLRFLSFSLCFVNIQTSFQRGLLNYWIINLQQKRDERKFLLLGILRCFLQTIGQICAVRVNGKGFEVFLGVNCSSFITHRLMRFLHWLMAAFKPYTRDLVFYKVQLRTVTVPGHKWTNHNKSTIRSESPQNFPHSLALDRNNSKFN